MARPHKEINWIKLNSYLQLKATKRMCSLLLEISEDTIERAIKREYDCTFKEYQEKHMAPIRLKLVQKAMSKALGGDNTLLIFCLKNLCGWVDRHETPLDQTDAPVLEVVINDNKKVS